VFYNYDIFHALARAHGLACTPEDGIGLFTTEIRVSGRLGGRAVHLVRRLGRAPSTTFIAALEPNLDLGLVVRPSSFGSWVSQLAGAVDVEVGDPAFDKAFFIRCDEPHRVKAFLSPRLRAALMTSKNAPITLDDRHVQLAYGGLDAIDDEHETLDRGLLAVVAIANEADAARAATPPPASVAPLIAELAAFARDRDLACAFDTPPRIIGRLGDLAVSIVIWRRKEHVQDLDIRLRFEQPLGFTFHLTTARSGIGAWLSSGVQEIGDPAIDRAFDVYADEPARVAALLDESTRRSLLELGQGRVLTLDSAGLSIVDDASDFDPVAVPALVERAADMMKVIARATRLPVAPTYR